jgi:protein SCO1/2
VKTPVHNIAAQSFSARFWSAAALCRFFAPSLLLAISCSFGFAASSIPSDTLTDSRLAEIKFDQKLNNTISLNLHFRDENNKDVRLGDYFSKKPVILVLGYYGCPMLCTMVLNGMVEGLQDLRWSIGKEYDVINVSIDPHETPSLAAAKKRSYLKRYGRDSTETGWHFLTGDADSIQRLADEVGFRYAYDPLSKQYAHPSGLVILTPDGKISRYLFGVTFSPRELYTSLDTASSRKIGSRIQDLILLCFHYRPITGRYGNIIMITVRVLGVATLLGLPALVVTMARKKSRSSRRNQNDTKELQSASLSPSDGERVRVRGFVQGQAQIGSHETDQSLPTSAATNHGTEKMGAPS